MKKQRLKMRSTRIIAALIFALIVFGTAVQAQEIFMSDLVDAGITPDSAFYRVDKIMEKLTLAFTFDKSKSVEIRLRVAEERLSEIIELIDKGDFEYLNQTEQDYVAVLDAVSELINEFGGGDNTIGESSYALRNAIKLELQTMSHVEKASFMKGIIIGKISNSNLPAEQISEIIDVLDRISLKVSDLERAISNKIQKIELREKIISDLTDEDIIQIKMNVPRNNSTNSTNQTGDMNQTGDTNQTGDMNQTGDTNSTDNNSTGTSNNTSTNEIKTKLEVKGNVLLSQESQSIIDSLLFSLYRTQGKIKLELKIKNTRNSTIVYKNKIKGNLTEDQLSLWEQLKDQVFLDVQSSGEKAEIMIKINHESKPDKNEDEEDDEDSEDEEENEDEDDDSEDEDDSEDGEDNDGSDSSRGEEEDEEDDTEDGEKEDDDFDEIKYNEGDDKKDDKDKHDDSEKEDKDDGDKDKHDDKDKKKDDDRKSDGDDKDDDDKGDKDKKDDEDDEDD